MENPELKKALEAWKKLDRRREKLDGEIQTALKNIKELAEGRLFNVDGDIYEVRSTKKRTLVMSRRVVAS